MHNSGSFCRWPLAGPAALSVSALMPRQGEKIREQDEFPKSLTHAPKRTHTHTCFKVNDDS